MSRKVLTRILIPAATAVVAETDLKCCKRSELPIYSPEPPKKKEKKSAITKCETPEPPGIIEESIGKFRHSIARVFTEMQHIQASAENLVHEGISQADWFITYLGADDNPSPKGPAIAIGGLTGFIFGLRGGVIRKVVFTSAGALGMASICFPKEAQHYSRIGFEESKKYAKIGYNFIYGVKKGDPALELPSMPKLPGSFSEAWTMVIDLSKSENSVVSEKGVSLEMVEVKEKYAPPSDTTVEEVKKRGCHSSFDGSLSDCPDDKPVPDAPICPVPPDPTPSCPDKA